MSNEQLSTLDRYIVDPRPPSRLAAPTDAKAEAVAEIVWPYVIAGFAWWFSAAAFFMPDHDLFDPVKAAVVILPSFLLPFAIYLWRESLLRKAAQQRLDEQKGVELNQRLEQSRQEALLEAHETTTALRSSLLRAAEVCRSLSSSLDRAADALDQAVVEHHARAFVPFWEGIESAASCLRDYAQGVRCLTEIAGKYYGKLERRNHTFPPFPYLLSDIPSDEVVIGRFRQVVRLGQTDYEFASIWEHRKTRETIQTGFGSLEAAVRQVGADVVEAVQDAEATVDIALKRFADAHASSSSLLSAAVQAGTEELERQRMEVCEILRRQDQKLDNIQRRRQPFAPKQHALSWPTEVRYSSWASDGRENER